MISMIGPQLGTADETEGASQPSNQACGACADPARVFVLTGYAGGQQIIERFCVKCAPRHVSAAFPVSEIRQRPNIGSILLVAGAIVASAGTVGLLWNFSLTSGFGIYQVVGAGLGALIAITAIFLGIDLLAIAGATVVGLAAGADWIAIVPTPHRAWLHILGIALGLACVTIGLALRRRRFPGSREAASCKV
ncbi:MAG: hypothetical protein HZB38_12875 [Planctomycetes bacterium]|nr:hypothetical protein [Planctomycetota bacterium]